jgi:hypothetical protein
MYFNKYYKGIGVDHLYVQSPSVFYCLRLHRDTLRYLPMECFALWICDVIQAIDYERSRFPESLTYLFHCSSVHITFSIQRKPRCGLLRASGWRLVRPWVCYVEILRMLSWGSSVKFWRPHTSVMLVSTTNNLTPWLWVRNYLRSLPTGSWRIFKGRWRSTGLPISPCTSSVA